MSTERHFPTLQNVSVLGVLISVPGYMPIPVLSSEHKASVKFLGTWKIRFFISIIALTTYMKLYQRIWGLHSGSYKQLHLLQ
jgi:hypothetical protein